MPSLSVGILLYRLEKGNIEVLLVHPGGPFWTDKDLHAWSVPKGLAEPGEAPFQAALREFQEETGFTASGNFIELPPAKTPGKTILVWAVEGDCDPVALHSNTFEMEWPPRSGKRKQFPEVDRAAWFGIEEGRGKIHKGQIVLLNELEKKLLKK